ncbi:MAG: hypothetical protein KAR64_09750 [Thermoplasmatales archaeon]|nr:hypothetical protein [Thermoplasmatales archaeon]
MTKKAEEKGNANSELFGMILPLLPNLLLKSGWAFLRFKMDAKRGGSIFQKELMNQGLDKTTAAELTEIYLEGSNLFQSLINRH